MALPPDDAPALISRSGVLISAASAFFITPVIQFTVCLLLAFLTLILSFPFMLGMAIYAALGFLLSSFAGSWDLYSKLYLCHPALCFLVLPAIHISVATAGGTRRTLRFASYAGTAIAGALLVRLAGASAFLGGIAALDGLCAAYVFERAPPIVAALRDPPIDKL